MLTLVLIMGDTVKDMTAKFGKLDKFEGNDFRRWQKKMHFLLTTLMVVYVLIEGSRDEIGTQYSYCYSKEEDPRTFDEAMKSHDVSFWKEAINDEMDSIMENNTWIYLIYHHVVNLWIASGSS
ncbi:hypothetical protein Tco_1083385 [Tanacetum coccineum]